MVYVTNYNTVKNELLFIVVIFVQLPLLMIFMVKCYKVDSMINISVNHALK